MLPHQNRSMFVALQGEKRQVKSLTDRVSALEKERDVMQQTVSCIQRYWNQVMCCTVAVVVLFLCLIVGVVHRRVCCELIMAAVACAVGSWSVTAK